MRPKKPERCFSSAARRAAASGPPAEEGAGHTGDGNQGKKYDNRSDSRADERNRQFAQGALNGLEAGLPSIPMQNNIFEDDDGVVDDQTDGGGEAAQSHQIEALIGHFQNDEGDEQSYRYDQSRDQ